jgi:hypothetical protein
MKVQNKYRAQPVRDEDGYFASKKEHKHWQLLKLRERAKEISKLERQVRFRLEHNGIHICDYVADFVYFEGQRRVVCDVKGFITSEFKLKAKMMRAFLNIDVETV